MHINSVSPRNYQRPSFSGIKFIRRSQRDAVTSWVNELKLSPIKSRKLDGIMDSYNFDLFKGLDEDETEKIKKHPLYEELGEKEFRNADIDILLCNYKRASIYGDSNEFSKVGSFADDIRTRIGIPKSPVDLSHICAADGESISGDEWKTSQVASQKLKPGQDIPSKRSWKRFIYAGDVPENFRNIINNNKNMTQANYEKYCIDKDVAKEQGFARNILNYDGEHPLRMEKLMQEVSSNVIANIQAGLLQEVDDIEALEKLEQDLKVGKCSKNIDPKELNELYPNVFSK